MRDREITTRVPRGTAWRRQEHPETAGANAGPSRVAGGRSDNAYLITFIPRLDTHHPACDRHWAAALTHAISNASFV